MKQLVAPFKTTCGSSTKALLFLKGVVLFFLVQLGYAQTNPIDSLKNEIKNATTPKDKVLLYDALAVQYWIADLDSAIIVGEKMIALSKEANYEEGVSKAYVKIGMAHLYKGDDVKAMEYANKVIALNNDPRSTATAYNLKGADYYYEYDFYKAIELYRKAFDIADEAGFDRIRASTLINIGMIYEELEDYKKAFDNYVRGIAFAKVAEDGTLLKTQGYYNYGDALLKAKEIDKAIEMLNQAAEISKSTENYNMLTYANGALALAYLEKGNNQKAIVYCKAAQEYLEQSTKGFYLVGSANLIFAKVYQQLGDNAAAIEFAKKAFDVSLEADNPQNIVDSSRILYTLLRDQNEYASMNRYLDYYMSYSDTIDQIGVKMKINNHVKELEMRNYELQKNEEISKTKQRGRYILFGVVISLVAIISSFLLWRNRKLSKLNKEKDDFLSTVSHEMKTPLNAILGFTKLLNKKVKNDQNSEYVEGIDEASKDLLTKVKDILRKSSNDDEDFFE